MNPLQVVLARWKRSTFFLAALLALYLVLFMPFWRSILLGFILASACAPMLNRLRKNMHARRSRVAYMVVGTGVITLVALVSFLLINFYSFAFQFFHEPTRLMGMIEKMAAVRDRLLASADQYGLFPTPAVHQKVVESLETITAQGRDFLLEGTQQFLRQSPHFLLGTFVFLLAFSGFLVAGPRVWRLMARLFGLSSNHRERFGEFEKICARTIGSHLAIGVAQATVVTGGAMAAGVGSPVLLWIVTLFFSMVPLLGGSSVPVCLAIVSFIAGQNGSGVILLVTAALSASSESLLRVWFFSKASSCHPIVSFISLLGGVILFGFVGLVIAPVVEQLVMAWILNREPLIKDYEISQQEVINENATVHSRSFTRDMRGEFADRMFGHPPKNHAHGGAKN